MSKEPVAWRTYRIVKVLLECVDTAPLQDQTDLIIKEEERQTVLMDKLYGEEQ